MAYNSGTGLLSDYTHLRTLPALLSIAFAVMSIYLFGGISEVYITWFNYTLTTMHALIGSLVIYAIAFASSETKAFDHYEDWEKGLIAMPPIVMMLHQFTNFVPNALQANSPWLPIVAFLASVVGWSVAVR